MARKVAVRSKEWLEACLAVDTTSRPIKASEYIELKCFICGSVGAVKVGNADHSLKVNGYARRCPTCSRKALSEHAKSRTGEKNPFFGKTHSEEVKKRISDSAADRMSKIPEERRKEMSERAASAAYEKYGGNPMHDPEVRKRQYDATHTSQFIESAARLGRLRVDEFFIKKMRDASKKYWGDDRDGEKRKTQRERFLARLQEHPEWEKVRSEGLAAYLTDAERVRLTWEKVRATCLELYGVENWQHSEDAGARAKTFSSRAELEILQWIQSLGLAAHKQRIDGRELDIYIPDKKIGIEYNGLYWHSEINKRASYHKNKTDFFGKRGIRVIHVFEHVWRDRQDQVKSYLRSALGCNENRVGARKCLLFEVPRQEAIGFLEKTHIQGAPRDMKLALGLYYQGQLVCLATFGHHHRGASNNFVLNRFAGANGWTVSGGLSRLSSEGAKRLGAIVTWADLSLSDGAGYVRAGWKIDARLNPDYFYTNFSEVFSKQSRKKGAVGTPEEVTEHQHALMDGLFKVYDCGKLRLSFVRETDP